MQKVLVYRSAFAAAQNDQLAVYYEMFLVATGGEYGQLPLAVKVMAD